MESVRTVLIASVSRGEDMAESYFASPEFPSRRERGHLGVRETDDARLAGKSTRDPPRVHDGTRVVHDRLVIHVAVVRQDQHDVRSPDRLGGERYGSKRQVVDARVSVV